MSEFKDWRGTPIEVGSRVLTHASASRYAPNRGIGRVLEIKKERYGPFYVHVKLTETSGARLWARVLTSNVTVLTKDMFDED